MTVGIASIDSDNGTTSEAVYQYVRSRTARGKRAPGPATAPKTLLDGRHGHHYRERQRHVASQLVPRGQHP